MNLLRNWFHRRAIDPAQCAQLVDVVPKEVNELRVDPWVDATPRRMEETAVGDRAGADARRHSMVVQAVAWVAEHEAEQRRIRSGQAHAATSVAAHLERRHGGRRKLTATGRSK